VSWQFSFLYRARGFCGWPSVCEREWDLVTLYYISPLSFDARWNIFRFLDRGFNCLNLKGFCPDLTRKVSHCFCKKCTFVVCMKNVKQMCNKKTIFILSILTLHNCHIEKWRYRHRAWVFKNVNKQLKLKLGRPNKFLYQVPKMKLSKFQLQNVN